MDEEEVDPRPRPSPGADRPQREDLYLRRLPAAADRPRRRWMGAGNARMLTPRSGGGWATYNGKIYVSGGEYQNERYNAAYRSLDAYDPVANRWEILPSLPGAVHGNAVAFIGNKFHTVSGKMEGGGLPDLPGKATADHSVMEMPAGGTR